MVTLIQTMFWTITSSRNVSEKAIVQEPASALSRPTVGDVGDETSQEPTMA
jgi:hypothetical protein